MEYCIDVLVEDFPQDRFRQPQSRETAWGTAVRAEEVGKLFWSDSLYVQPYPPIPHLLRYLPREWRSVEWKWLSLGGTTLEDVERFINDTPSYSDYDLSLIRELFHTLLNGRTRWAVFLAFNCDEIAAQYYHSVDELVEAVVEAYKWDSTAGRGFCSLPIGSAKDA